MSNTLYIIFEWLLGSVVQVLLRMITTTPAIPNLTLKVKKLHNFPFVGSSKSDLYKAYLTSNGKNTLVRTCPEVF
jgi:hypothetical protein